MTSDYASALDIDLERHILRQENYKGRKRELSSQSLRLPFDGWTLPALYVVASWLKTSRTSLRPLSL